MAKRFIIKATVTLDVEIAIEAENGEEAEKIFDEQLTVAAGLAELPTSKYDVNEDSISEVDIEDVSEEE